MSAADFDPLPPSLPGSNQNVTINASGPQFGAGFWSTTTGCLQPPCATLSIAPPITNPIVASTVFSWTTDCSHLNFSNGCASSSTYSFVLRASDDYCNAPAVSFGTYEVTILPLPSSITNVIDTVCDAYQAPDGSILDSSGTYTFYLSGQGNLCDSIVMLQLEVIKDSLIYSNPVDLTEALGQSASFSVQSLGGDNYQWQTDLGLGFQNLMDAGQYSGANSNTLTISSISTQNENQLLRCIVSSQACIDTSSVAFLTISGLDLNGYNLSSRVRIIPNPTSGNFRIEPFLEGQKSIQVIYAFGRLVEQGPWKEGFDFSHLNTGVYVIYLIFNNGGSIQRRLVVL